MEDSFDNLPCGVLVFDHSLRIIHVNQKLLELIGADPGELGSQPIDVIFPKGARIFLQTHFLPLLHMYGRFEEVYFELQYRDGERTPVLINASMSEDGARTYCTFVTVRERTRYEDALLEARRAAEKANQAKVKFLSMISHDLRTPLQAISGFSDVLQREMDGPLNDNQQEHVSAIRLASGELRRLIDDILGFATLESGNMQLDVKRVGVRDALDRAEVLVRMRMEEAGIELSRPPVNDSDAVVADPDRLQQVLLNLLTNAWKFTPRGETITLGFERSDEKRGFIFVRDTGKGIEADMLEEIFQPFAQLEADETDAGERGVGLGLAISRELARAMGGDLSAESTPGAGSTFRVELELAATVHEE